MDVEEFFDLGAALGLQIRTTTANGGEWAEESGELLFCKVSSVVRSFSKLPSTKGLSV